MQRVGNFLLFSPFGVGYAMSFNEVMDLDRDVFDILYEKKMATIENIT